MNIIQGSLPNKANYKKGRSAAIKYIVIHFTANKGDKAVNNVKYFANNSTGTSAHFFADENSVYTSVPVSDTAYHCGGGLQGSKGHTYYKICTNSNSIGVEMCLWDKQGNIRKGTISKAAELTRYLMKEYNIPIAKVIRHWDVTGKNCPGPMVGDNNALWNEFKSKLSTKLEGKKMLETGNDIVWELMNGKHKVKITEVDKAVKALDMAKNNDEFCSLYWILYKLVNGNG